ncbi:MAG: DeoR/GlpR transcriptional regulator, partial [Actinobacteria bacterium]|nr:DeoR/GlpR transcriptional regulator [Actinomycetota bacterium]
IDNLTEELGVSRVTIQRDINVLEERGLVSKVRGGVKLKGRGDGQFETRFTVRLKNNYEKKVEIAKKALAYVNDGETIFLDSSSTVFVFAQELFKRHFFDLNIVTISPAIICEALKYPDVRIICAGGQLRQSFSMFYGAWTIEFLQEINIDSSFISAAGVSIDGNCTSSDIELVNILNVVCSRSKNLNILVDSSKFLNRGMLNLSTKLIRKRIITDSQIDEDIASKLEALDNVELIK